MTTAPKILSTPTPTASPRSGRRAWALIAACLALFVLPAATCDPDQSMSENLEDTADNVDEAGEEVSDEFEDAGDEAADEVDDAF